jgi:hypothetical protein
LRSEYSKEVFHGDRMSVACCLALVGLIFIFSVHPLLKLFKLVLHDHVPLWILQRFIDRLSYKFAELFWRGRRLLGRLLCLALVRAAQALPSNTTGYPSKRPIGVK